MGNIEQNKKIISIGIFSLIVFIIVLTVSYAFLNQTVTGTKNQVITSGNLRLTLNEGNELTLNNALPVYDEVGMIQIPFTFTLTNNTAYNTNYIMKLEDITEATDKLSPSIVKYGLEKDGTRSIDLISDLEDMAIDKEMIKGNQVIEYTLRLWIDSSVEDENLINGKSLSYKIAIEAVKGTYTDNSKANEPELTSGMIPVTYNEKTKQWLKADTTGKWYDYDTQWWANAVTVTETTRENYMKVDAGTPISMDDINTMWVWIPRYEYQYTDLGSQYAGGTKEQPGEIKIRFISKEQVTPSDDTVYKIPAGFQFGDENLSGFWMGKFETTGSMSAACTNEECVTADLTVLPNKSAIGSQNVSSFFYASRSMQNATNASKYGFDAIGTGTMDVHMLKNTEWGSVAYLSQSKYGKYGNSNYEGPNKEIYQNKSKDYITGSSNGTPSTPTYNEQVPYDTPDTGYGASTTGTIYGVYDMSGGANEYVMGNYNRVSGYSTSDNSGFKGTNGPTSGGLEWPDIKYYDLYTSTTASVGYKTGDATYEVSKWYNDYSSFVNSSSSWFKRGGYHGYNTDAGIFYFCNSGGGKNSPVNGFRLTITP